MTEDSPPTHKKVKVVEEIGHTHPAAPVSTPCSIRYYRILFLYQLGGNIYCLQKKSVSL